MAKLEGGDLDVVLKQCERIEYGKVTITLYADAVVGITTEEQRRVVNKPRHAA
jgi:hypothetical protein